MGIITDLAVFLRARWDEEEDGSVLFHEFTCPVPQQTRQDCRCSCPCPTQIRTRISTHRRILTGCEQRIRREHEAGPCWPLESILAFQGMKALALPFELHPDFQDSWYP
ncbi:DUF6221 family protein [Streptomyces sp. NPDC001107]